MRKQFIFSKLWYFSTYSAMLSIIKHSWLKSHAFILEQPTFPTEVVDKSYGKPCISKYLLLWTLYSTYISRLCPAILYDLVSLKSWKIAQAVETVFTSDRNTSCHLPRHLPLSFPQRNATEAFVGHSKAYGTPLNSWSVQRAPWNYNHGLQEQTAADIDIYLRPFWLLASTALFSVELCQLTFKWVSGTSIQTWGNSSNCPT